MIHIYRQLSDARNITDFWPCKYKVVESLELVLIFETMRMRNYNYKKIGLSRHGAHISATSTC